MCRSCGVLFNSTLAFDKHRVGDYNLSRRCLTTSEMAARGMSRLDDGFWVTRRRVVPHMPVERRTVIAGAAFDVAGKGGQGCIEEQLKWPLSTVSTEVG